MRRFEGKVALLSGAASGIGRATALQLAGEGASLLGIDLNQDGLEETAKRVAAEGGQMEWRRCDVTDRDACREAVDAAMSSFGRLDVLGNIAGVNRFAHFHEMTPETWELLLSVNLTGVVWMCQAAIPKLIETEGSIVNLASSAALIGQAYTAAYCATKAGVAQLTKALAMEYARTGIRVNAIAPGMVATEMNVGIEIPDDINPKLMSRYASFRGACQPEEIARLFAYLASDDARFAHGAIWAIDGGSTAG